MSHVLLAVFRLCLICSSSRLSRVPIIWQQLCLNKLAAAVLHLAAGVFWLCLIDLAALLWSGLHECQSAFLHERQSASLERDFGTLALHEPLHAHARGSQGVLDPGRWGHRLHAGPAGCAAAADQGIALARGGPAPALPVILIGSLHCA